jgi:hypothetical protein
MEIEFPDGVEIQMDKNCEIFYPEYIAHLSEEEMDAAKRSEEANDLIVSAGTDPVDQKILFCTASGKMMIFDSKKYHIPNGPSHPSRAGKEIFLPNINGRWPGPSPGFSMNSKWVISKSASAFIGAKLDTTYRGENKTT